VKHDVAFINTCPPNTICELVVLELCDFAAVTYRAMPRFFGDGPGVTRK
jgi:hypothetical protein